MTCVTEGKPLVLVVVVVVVAVVFVEEGGDDDTEDEDCEGTVIDLMRMWMVSFLRAPGVGDT
jgi:hypothetical protein